MIHKLLWIIVFLNFLILAKAPIKCQDDIPSPPKISHSILFERKNIRENEPLPLIVQISNESKYELSDNKLTIDAPDFLKVYKEDCAGNLPDSEIDVKTIASGSIEKQKLCLKIDSQSQSRVGDFNILFTFKYSVTNDNRKYNYFVTDEKTLTVDVFGTNSVAGIPLAFAVFIVPGMFFWLILRLWKIPFSLSIGVEEKLMLSVLVSIICLGIVFILNKIFAEYEYKFLFWVKYFDTTNTVSISKLLALALAGVILGILFVTIFRLVQNHLRNKEKNKIITPNDDNLTIVKKILQLNPDYKGVSVVIRLKDKSEYIGSHFAKTVDSIFLVPAFQIDKQQLTPGIVDELEPQLNENGNLIQEASELSKVIDLLARNSVSIDVRNPLSLALDNGQSKPLGKVYYKWNQEEVTSIVPEFYKDRKLLELV